VSGDALRGTVTAEPGFGTGVGGERGRERVLFAVGLAVLVAVAGRTLLAVAANLPFEPVGVPAGLRAVTTGASTALAGAALIVVAALADGTTTRVGLLFAGGFGLLAAVPGALPLSGAVAVALGGLVALAGTGRPGTYRGGRRWVVALALLVGLALALGSGVGLLGAGVRGAATLLVALSAAALAVHVDGDRPALVAGGAAFLVTLVAALAAPFVVGSTLLVAFAVVGVPPLVAAVAVGGVTAAGVAGLRRGEYALALGAPLVLLAGAPVAVPRALVLLLGVALVFRLDAGGVWR
jgi:hypothetical protein